MTVQASVDPTNLVVEDCEASYSSYYFFGVTATAAGNTCWCTSTPVLLGIVIAAPSYCFQPCTGNQFEMCGDVGYMLMYGTPINHTIAASTVTLPLVTSIFTTTLLATVTNSALVCQNITPPGLTGTVSISPIASTYTVTTITSAIVVQNITLQGSTSTFTLIAVPSTHTVTTINSAIVVQSVTLPASTSTFTLTVAASIVSTTVLSTVTNSAIITQNITLPVFTTTISICANHQARCQWQQRRQPHILGPVSS